MIGTSAIPKNKKVRQKSESPETTNRKTIVQRTDSNEETAESDEEYPLQLAPGNLHMLLRSSKNNGKSLTLIKNLDNSKSKQYNQAAHNRKLIDEEAYKKSDIDFTVDSSTNIKESRIKNYTEIEREPRIKNFNHIEDPNVIHEKKRKFFQGKFVRK